MNPTPALTRLLFFRPPFGVATGCGVPIWLVVLLSPMCSKSRGCVCDAPPPPSQCTEICSMWDAVCVTNVRVQPSSVRCQIIEMIVAAPGGHSVKERGDHPCEQLRGWGVRHPLKFFKKRGGGSLRLIHLSKSEPPPPFQKIRAGVRHTPVSACGLSCLCEYHVEHACKWCPLTLVSCLGPS